MYESTRVMPYVYVGTHRLDGRIYIGSRYSIKQKYPSHIDLPKYRTSSKIVRPIFDEFDWIIVAEFFTPEAAHNYEQRMIQELWGRPGLLNQAFCVNDEHRFMNGLQGKKLTEDHKRKIAAAHKGKVGVAHTEEAKQAMSLARKGKPSTRVGFKHTEEHKQRMSLAGKGRKRSAEDILKQSKRFVVTDPTGVEYTITNLHAFCREHSLTGPLMTCVARGKYSNHKGWLCRYAD